MGLSLEQSKLILQKLFLGTDFTVVYLYMTSCSRHQSLAVVCSTELGRIFPPSISGFHERWIRAWIYGSRSRKCLIGVPLFPLHDNFGRSIMASSSNYLAPLVNVFPQKCMQRQRPWDASLAPKISFKQYTPPTIWVTSLNSDNSARERVRPWRHLSGGGQYLVTLQGLSPPYTSFDCFLLKSMGHSVDTFEQQVLPYNYHALYLIYSPKLRVIEKSANWSIRIWSQSSSTIQTMFNSHQMCLRRDIGL
jgi:hypothetical protein